VAVRKAVTEIWSTILLDTRFAGVFEVPGSEACISMYRNGITVNAKAEADPLSRMTTRKANAKGKGRSRSSSRMTNKKGKGKSKRRHRDSGLARMTSGFTKTLRGWTSGLQVGWRVGYGVGFHRFEGAAEP
jgi:hypothetical protein